jgi:MYXO-CTERM domain-containing protein
MYNAGATTPLSFNSAANDYSDAFPIGTQYLVTSTDGQVGGKGGYDLFLADRTTGALWPMTDYNADVNSMKNELGSNYTPYEACVPGGGADPSIVEACGADGGASEGDASEERGPTEAGKPDGGAMTPPSDGGPATSGAATGAGGSGKGAGSGGEAGSAVGSTGSTTVTGSTGASGTGGGSPGSSEASSGCGCHVGQEPSGRMGALLLFGWIGLLARRIRSRWALGAPTRRTARPSGKPAHLSR